MSIGVLSGKTKDDKTIEVVFESFFKSSGIENAYNIGGLVNVSQSSNGLTANIAGVSVGGNKPKKPDFKVLTIDEFKRTSSGRWATHEILGAKNKPKLEFIGPSLEEISFSILLNSSVGVDPEAELIKLRQFRDEGIICTLILGSKQVTDHSLVIQRIDEAHKTIDNKGKILVAAVNLSLMEYM